MQQPAEYDGFTVDKKSKPVITDPSFFKRDFKKRSSSLVFGVMTMEFLIIYNGCSITVLIPNYA